MGADTVAAARSYMMSIGCIQSLKCHTNRCPTGVATQDPTLIAGLDVADKRLRAASFHRKTVEAFLDLMSACGFSSIEEVRSRPTMMVRTSPSAASPVRELYPNIKDGELLELSEERLNQRLGRECTNRDRLIRAWGIALKNKPL